jgi:hypothetical protein
MFRLGGILLEIDNVLVIILKVLFAKVVDDWLAILLLLVRALVSVELLVANYAYADR